VTSPAPSARDTDAAPASSEPTSGGSGSERPAPDLVVVANRLPVDLVTDDDGSQRWEASPGGLVSALAPSLRDRDGAWVGWPGVADADPEPFVDEGMALHPVRLDADEVAAHYEGFANATLWPLYHDVVVAPVFDRDWWEVHRRVNERFAEVAAAVAGEGATVWVQDYQLQLVPQMLRERRPDLRIGFFLHIPFPPVELFLQLPWRREVVDGLLGADLVGFHTTGGARNFRWLARRLCGAEIDDGDIDVRETFGTVRTDERTVRVGAFPISIDSAAFAERAADPAVAERSRELRRELGDPRTVLLGVDRLDYTKGIEVRLAAYGEVLDHGDLDPSETVMVQVATPSRERVDAYRRTRDEVERTVGRINGDHGTVSRAAIQYLHRSLPPEELTALYGAADVMLVTPLRDGMNLVAKEYVASRTDDTGALVLSEFTGAAEELADGAWMVNPHDLDGVARAIRDAAAAAGTDEGRERMARLRAQVREHDVELWADAFLGALASS
jgi:trehalose 6-phosphate synthase